MEVAIVSDIVKLHCAAWYCFTGADVSWGTGKCFQDSLLTGSLWDTPSRCVPALQVVRVFHEELQPRSHRLQADLIQFIYVFLLPESQHGATIQPLASLP